MGNLTSLVEGSEFFGNIKEGLEKKEESSLYSETPATPSYSPGDFGAPSPGDWSSDYDMDQD